MRVGNRPGLTDSRSQSGLAGASGGGTLGRQPVSNTTTPSWRLAATAYHDSHDPASLPLGGRTTFMASPNSGPARVVILVIGTCPAANPQRATFIRR